MSEGQGDKGGPGNRNGLLIIGLVLIVGGLWTLGGMSWPTLEPVFGPVGDAFREARRWIAPLALVIAGVAVLVFASKGGVTFSAPARGAKLYRSRSQRMISGVIGGLAEYLSMDATLLRIAYVALALLTNAGPFILAYIVASIIVPEEPPETLEPPVGADPGAQ